MSRLTGTDRKTVARLALSIGRGCAELHDRIFVGLRVHRIECDELWAYIGHKRNPQHGKPTRSPVKGDQYTYIALASSTRAIIGYRTGKRDSATTDDFVQDCHEHRVAHDTSVPVGHWHCDGGIPCTGPLWAEAGGRPSTSASTRSLPCQCSSELPECVPEMRRQLRQIRNQLRGGPDLPLQMLHGPLILFSEEGLLGVASSADYLDRYYTADHGRVRTYWIEPEPACAPIVGPTDDNPEDGARIMDKDRIEGAAEQAKGKVKEVAGKVTGDEKTKQEGRADQAAGKAQNTWGSVKDTLRGE